MAKNWLPRVAQKWGLHRTATFKPARTVIAMRIYRASILCVLLFAVAYPVVSGGVLATSRRTSVIEIYPIAPWSLFCFIPNRESDFGVQLHTVDGNMIDDATYFNEHAELSEKERIIAYNVVQRMGAFHDAEDSTALYERREFFERSVLAQAAGIVSYELVRRDFDVLERWKTGECDRVESLVEFQCRDVAKKGAR